MGDDSIAFGKKTTSVPREPAVRFWESLVEYASKGREVGHCSPYTSAGDGYSLHDGLSFHLFFLAVFSIDDEEKNTPSRRAFLSFAPFHHSFFPYKRDDVRNGRLGAATRQLYVASSWS